MNEKENYKESPFSVENLERLENKPPNWLMKVMAITRYSLLIASPFFAYWYDNPSGFGGWIACLILWGLLVWLINFVIGMLSAALIKHF